MASAVLAGVSSSVADYFLNKQASKDNLKLQKKYYDYTFGKENERQDYLMANSAQIQKNNLLNAGLSPNLMAEGANQLASPSVNSGSTAAGTANYSGVAGTFADSMTALANLDLIRSQARKNNAEADEVHDNAESQRSLNWVMANVKDLEGQYLVGKNAREEALNKVTIEEINSRVNLFKLQGDEQEITNDIKKMEREAMGETYTFQGKKVKGYQIPNFKELFALQLAKQANDIAQQNANTNEAAVEGDPVKLLTNSFLVPVVKWLEKAIPDSKEFKKIVHELSTIAGMSKPDGSPYQGSPTGPTP